VSWGTDETPEQATPTRPAQRPRASPPPSLPPIEPGANVQRWWRLKQTEGLLDKAYAREDALSADLSRVTAEAEALRERVRVLESEAAMASEQKQRLVEAVHENKQAAEQQAVQAVDMQARCNAVAAQAAEEAAKAKAEADAAKKLASNLQRVVDALCPIDSPEPPLVQPCARPPLTPLPQVQTKPAPGHEALKVQWPERRLDVNRPDNDKVKALGARPRTHAGRFLYWVKPAGVDPAKFQAFSSGSRRGLGLAA
jgi:chemotaxis protein histidine kinase CheA